MRTAIVHYWLLNMRGGEKVLEALCRLLPDADIFTLFYDPDRVSPTIRDHRVRASFLQPLRKHYRSLLPLMPMALESFDLREYDLVISSESGPAKGVITSSGTRHVCYCHTPMRYLWDLYPAYRNEWTRARWKRALMTPLTNYLRLWDYASAARVDEFIANSENVRRRIWKTYRRESHVIRPPVAVDTLLLETARGLLPDRLGTGALQAGRCGRPRFWPKWTKASHRGRRAGIQGAKTGRDVQYRILRPGERRGTARVICPLPRVSHAGRGGFRDHRRRSARERQARDRVGQRRCG